MSDKLKEKAARILISSLVGSNLSIKELKKIANDFIYDEGFSYYIGSIIKHMVSSLENEKITNTSNNENDHYWNTRDLVDDTIKIIRKKRIPKDKLLNIIDSNWDNSISKNLNRSLAIIDIITKFYDNISIDEIYKFVDLLDYNRNITNDKYLDGIMNKKNNDK